MDITESQGETAAIHGKIAGFTRHELETILSGHGFAEFANKPKRTHHCAFCEDPDAQVAQAARKLGVRVVDNDHFREFLGPPLGNLRARLQHAFDLQMRGTVRDEKYRMWNWVQVPGTTRPKHDQVIVPDKKYKAKPYEIQRLTMGPGCDIATLARIEDRIGFPLPEPARNLFSEVNGITLFWNTKTSDLLEAEPLEWDSAMSLDGAFWRELQRMKASFGLAIIPPVEVMFGEWRDRLFWDGGGGPMPLGKKRTIDSDTFFSNLFFLDGFRPSWTTGLFADAETQSFWAVLSGDHGADWESFEPIPFEVYVENLVAHLGTKRFFTHRGRRPSPRDDVFQSRADR